MYACARDKPAEEQAILFGNRDVEGNPATPGSLLNARQPALMMQVGTSARVPLDRRTPAEQGGVHVVMNTNQRNVVAFRKMPGEVEAVRVYDVK